MTRILIVDDSIFVREQIRQLLLAQNDCTVIGEARHGEEGVEMAIRLRPDVIIMDVDMPVMDGIEATRIIMETAPAPILIHTSSYVSRSRNVPFEAIQMGALDILEKPDVYPLSPQEQRKFINRIRITAGVKVFRRMKARETPATHPVHTLNGATATPALLAIAASTGGPKVIYDIFSMLPPLLPVPVLLVQHIGPAFVAGFIEWLQTTTSVQFKIAEEGEQLLPNVCYVAPGGKHLTARAPRNISLSDAPPVHSCKPSADMLFSSVSSVFGGHAVGILLTGIGEDGANGLLQMRNTGAITIAQDEESSVVFGMPRRAIEMNAASVVGNVTQITQQIKRLFKLE